MLKPFRTMLSVYIAIYRVYPMLKDYIFSKGLCAYPAIEIYSKDIEVEIVLIFNRIFYLFKPLVPNFETLNPFLLESLELKKNCLGKSKIILSANSCLEISRFRSLGSFWKQEHSSFLEFVYSVHNHFKKICFTVR